MSRCLYCYGELHDGETDFHASCSKKIFGEKSVPVFGYSRSDMDMLAKQIVASQTTITGVQPKLSLHLQKHEGSKRLTIVGMQGNFIFKPQTELYRKLPEIEDLTMHLAEIAKIDVVPHSLIRLADGELGYISRRIDRADDNSKIAMEDMCQLTNRTTEHKYRSSYEQIAKKIAEYSTTPKLDLVNFYNIVIFSWITGNADMHLKNFSMFSPDDIEFRLTPAYDLVSTAIVNPSDTEELALTLNGKKSRIEVKDFIEAAARSNISEKIIESLFRKYLSLARKWEIFIDSSFLDDSQKTEYIRLIENRLLKISDGLMYK